MNIDGRYWYASKNRVIVSEWRPAATSLRQRRMSSTSRVVDLWLRTMGPSTRSAEAPLAQGDLLYLH
jgi:hypothetical protein